MTAQIAQAQEAIRRCRELRESGKVEAVLRSEILSRLRLIFPSTEDESWINHYSTGTEALTKIGKAGGKLASRFIDNLIGATTIEYEPDLRIQAKHKEGFGQVKDHAAGLIRSGIAISQIRGILSDTVDWYAYDISLAASIDPKACAGNDIALLLVDELRLTSEDAHSAELLVNFIRKHLARKQSRPLKADLLTFDLGLDSGSYQRTAGPLLKLIIESRTTDSSVALATDLWSRFVDYLEGNVSEFRASAYADEAYLCILARLLSANVLAEKALSSDAAELKSIIDGSYFRAHYQLSNMVERDYFGWLTNPQHVDKIIPLAREIQRDLYAYDFSYRPEEDLFGRLMAQLARRSQRKLLGQEWTPAWLSKLLAERCLENLPSGEDPRIVDMCCGSGSILAEVLKAAKTKFHLSGIAALHEVATGFDIDPLAVCLSKTTWVITLAPEIKAASSPIVIPIYHADSLFAITPVSAALPFIGEKEAINISLDGVTIALPHEILQPSYRDLFDHIVDWAYDEALDAQKTGHSKKITDKDVQKFLLGSATSTGTALTKQLEAPLVTAVHALVNRMVELALANRNGIWAFILRNTYRPGLLSGQFNGLVSNPPWLALSGLADNPYREVLTARAKIYGIRPSAQSFLHLELGTTHLLHAVDRYLKPGSSVACLVPGTIFNGHHHDPLRQRTFLTSKRPVALEISEVWQVAPGTFKYPGAAIIGHKHAKVSGLKEKSINGFLAQQVGLEETDFSIRTIGERTAWVLEKDGLPIISAGMKDAPQQGADLMPRTAVCIEIIKEAGAEYQVDTPHKDSLWSFTVKAAKELKNERFPGHVAPKFIYRIAQSENLLPFLLGKHCAPIAIPGERDTNGAWKIYDDTEIRRQGFIETSRRFQAINAKLTAVGQGKSIQGRVDERGKLTKQVFESDSYLILAGAGGKHICAAFIPAKHAQGLVIDQTLYWKVIQNGDEALFYVGVLNSHAMTEAITPFNPKGSFGERHIHALPYRLMPAFDPSNEDHLRISALTWEITKIVRGMVEQDDYLNDPHRALTQRRSKLRAELKKIKQFSELESLCSAALGTTSVDDQDR